MKTEIRHKVLIQVSVRELHIDMLKKYATGIFIIYDEELIIRIIYSALQLLLTPQLGKMTKRHQVMHGCEICILSGN